LSHMPGQSNRTAPAVNYKTMLTEIENYRIRLADLRRLIKELVIDLTPEALNWRPVPEAIGEMNSLAVMVSHVAGAERFWIVESIGGQPQERDRDAEFKVLAGSVEELLTRLDHAASQTEAVLAALDPAELDRVIVVRGKQVSVRWALAHVLEHTAIHFGHMQITRQLWAGGMARPSPLWYDRLPKPPA
jgi:uncharacterized damage-inducible protein DinB